MSNPRPETAGIGSSKKKMQPHKMDKVVTDGWMFMFTGRDGWIRDATELHFGKCRKSFQRFTNIRD